jgi:hypothetical protein
VIRKILAASAALAMGAGLALIAVSPAVADDELTPPVAVAALDPSETPAADAEEPTAPPVDDSALEPGSEESPIAEPESEAEPPLEDQSEEQTEERSEEPQSAFGARLAPAVFAAAAAAVSVQQCAAMNPATYVTSTARMFFEDRVGGSHTLTATGMQISWAAVGGDLSLAKSAGYIPVTIPFEEIGTPALGYTSSTGASAGLNLTLFKDGAWWGNLVYEPLFADFWINKAVTGMPAGPNPGYQLAYGTLDEFLTAFVANGSDVDVVAVGYSGGSGSQGTGVVTSLTAGCDTWLFASPPPPTNQVCTAFSSVVVTDLAQLDLSQSRALGHQELETGALRVWTEAAPVPAVAPDPRKAAGYLDVPDFPLTSTGTLAVGWTGTNPPPGGQLVVDLDDDTVPDGILVFEPSFYGQNVWLASIRAGFSTVGAPTVGGGGGSINGSIDQYLANWPDAKGLAIGYSLGSGVTGDGKLTLLQAGCIQVTFDAPFSLPTLPIGGGGGNTGGQLDTLALTGADRGPGLALGAALLLVGLGLAGAAAAGRRRPIAG